MQGGNNHKEIRRTEGSGFSPLEPVQNWIDLLAAGILPSEVKDINRKISPYLVAWQELPQSVRQWDGDAVREIPALLAKVGLRICRTTARRTA